jgi:hypothetical protein
MLLENVLALISTQPECRLLFEYLVQARVHAINTSHPSICVNASGLPAERARSFLGFCEARELRLSGFDLSPFVLCDVLQ